MKKRCRICDKKLLYTQKLCDSEACHRASDMTAKRVLKQHNAYVSLALGKRCKRCLTKVYETSMKQYCIKCEEDINMKKCDTCDDMVQNQRTFCDNCKDARARDAMKRQIETRRINANKKAKKGSGLPNKWLVRGTISSNSTACVISNSA